MNNILKYGTYEDLKGYYLEVWCDGVLINDLYFEKLKDLKEQMEHLQKFAEYKVIKAI